MLPTTNLPDWDLSDLYSGTDAPQIEEDKDEIQRLVETFNQKYKGKINSPDLTADFLVQCLRDYEKLLEKKILFSNYFFYLYAKDTQSQQISKLLQKAKELSTWVSQKTLWFTLEWIELDDIVANKLISNKKLEDYKHFLKTERIFKPFRLSEKEEKLLTQKSQTSSQAFVQLYDLINNGIEFELRIKGETKKLSQSELSPYLTRHPDRKVRKQAAQSYTKGIKNYAKQFTFIQNSLLFDKKINDQIRNYQYPQQSTFLTYEVNRKTIENLTETVTKNHSICKDFYETKKKILGYKKLHEWDRYSPIAQIDQTFSWQEAKEIIVNSFQDFSPTFAQIANKFYDNNWIDAKPAKGKQSGAFCSYGTPSSHPYILVNYTNKIKDVLTLAHELGHGIHHYLSRDQKLLEYWSSTAVAEIASIFSEELVFNSLYNQLKTKKDKMELLSYQIQSSFSSIFRQIAFYLFELDTHTHYRKNGELNTKEFNHYYQKRLQAMFGSSLELTKQHQYWWMPVLHFFHYNFYVFAYAFGNLITLSLINQSKKDQNFEKKYIKALTLGGSNSPKEIIATLNLDLQKKDFWQQGLNYLNDLVVKFNKLV